MTIPLSEAATERLVELPYHRLFRAQPTYRWWRPLVALILLGVFAVLASMIVFVPFVVYAVATGEVRLDPQYIEDDMLRLAAIDATSPFKLLLALLNVAVWLPCVPIALRCAGIRPAGIGTSIVNSVTFRLRWRWLARCLPPAAVATLASIGGLLAIGLAGGDGLAPLSTPLPLLLVNLLIIVIVVPFQAAAEEFVFRGVVMQVVGAWLRWLPFALVLPTVLFALGHIYDVWGLIDVGVFGVVAAFVTWRTGGLEAAIAIHAINNILAFGVLATGILGTTTVEQAGSSPLSIGITMVTMVGFAIWVDRMAGRHGIERFSAIRVVAPVPAAPMTPSAPGVGDVGTRHIR